MLINSNTLKGHDYLDLYKISEGKYVIGNFQFGITAYKQQIRALNIFHELVKNKIINLEDESFRVAIVGAGFAGLTFSAAAVKAGLSVTLIEKYSSFLPLQIRCNNRYLHPNMYDWPNVKSLVEFTELPILNWEYDTARNVSNNIIKQFNEIVNNSNSSPTRGQIFEKYLNCKKINLIERQTTGQFRMDFTTGDQVSTIMPNLIIFAPGFGVEVGAKTNPRTPSFWENDALDQFKLSQNKNAIVISGIGDGGLTDAFRCVIPGFNFELILDAMKSNNSKYEFIVSELTKIQNGALKTEDENYYFNKFSEIQSGNFSYINDYLNSEGLYSGIKVFLNDRGKRPLTLDHNKISLLNAFLAYVFYKFKKIEYITGNIKPTADGKYLIGSEDLQKKLECDFLFWNRRGADRMDAFKDLGLSKQELEYVKNKLARRQETVRDFGFIQPRWKYTEFYKHFNKLKTFAFLTEGTQKVFIEFIKNLDNFLSKARKDQAFRLSVHRVIKLESQDHYQQVTPHIGSGSYFDKTGLGQVFEINRGNIGLSAQVGIPTLIVRKEEIEFQNIAKFLNVKSKYTKAQQSFFSLPILSSLDNNTESKVCNFVLYIDSTSQNFFESSILNAIGQFATAFVDKIDKELITKPSFKEFHELFSTPDLIDEFKDLTELKKNKCWVDISHEFQEMETLKKYCTFSFYN